jgi:signal transduction histidine kinase
MRERALLVGGEFQIESRPGIGTRVRLLVPITSGDDYTNER